MRVDLPMVTTGVAETGAVSTVTQTADGSGFGEFLQKALSEVNNLQNVGSLANQQLLTGETTDLHNVMIAGEKANLALQLTVQVRNKVIEAYQEVMRMQV